MEESRTRERLSLLRQKTRRQRKRTWRLSSARRIPGTAAASREAVRHSARHVPDSRVPVRYRERAQHRGHAPDNRGLVRYREPALQESVRRARRREPARWEKHVRQGKADRLQIVRYVLRDRHREHVRQEKADRHREHVRQEKAGRRRVHVRQEKADRRRVHVRQGKDARQERADQQETARRGLRDRHREHARQGKADRRETVRHALTARYVPTDPREAVLSAKEDRGVRTEEKEADAIRDQAVQDRAETGEIPAGTIWALPS